ncbi:conserved phage C-terminal domain-containing protein [Pseudoalteromonas sp.]|uniref:conserved phage C-terminal domain-containing protein n=1 Tax=Pseudoalteromonas sp. TaxID=53249 RepID=UPI002614426A|nr:conserved phage C-terminal domain-containing protein [Pseudoalteromonas sp.]MCP4585371.1 hypothetical protein [Pseudoalteromonas sp.]
MKKSFILYCDQYEPVRNLTEAQKSSLFDAIFKFHCGEDVTFKDKIAEMAFRFFLQTFQRDNDKYLKKCERLRNNAKSKSSRNAANRTEKEQIEGDSDSVSVSDSVSKYIVEILDYLNNKMGTKYKTTTKKTQTLITARIREKFTVEDFKAVIDTKYTDWFHKPEFQQYLRPETLFGTKFESYLNSSPTQPKIKKVYTGI